MRTSARVRLSKLRVWLRDVVFERRAPVDTVIAIDERITRAFDAGREEGRREGYKEGLEDASRALKQLRPTRRLHA